MPRTPPDWTRTGTVEGYARYLCKQSDALCVVVIRPFNSVLAADPKLAPAAWSIGIRWKERSATCAR